MWADEMGGGWGGVRDKSQRGLGPWEPLLLWSVKSTGSQWSTWPLQRAYSSRSACEGDDKTPSADPRGHVCSSSGRFGSIWAAFCVKVPTKCMSLWNKRVTLQRRRRKLFENANGWLSCDYRLCPKSLTRHHMAHYIMCLPYSKVFFVSNRSFLKKL